MCLNLMNTVGVEKPVLKFYLNIFIFYEGSEVLWICVFSNARLFTIAE